MGRELNSSPIRIVGPKNILPSRALSPQDSEYLGALFSLVSGRQIAAACRLAHKYRDHKLALLLSQLACGNVNSRQLAYEQMTMWRRMGVRRGASYFGIEGTDSN